MAWAHCAQVSYQRFEIRQTEWANTRGSRIPVELVPIKRWPPMPSTLEHLEEKENKRSSATPGNGAQLLGRFYVPAVVLPVGSVADADSVLYLQCTVCTVATRYAGLNTPGSLLSRTIFSGVFVFLTDDLPSHIKSWQFRILSCICDAESKYQFTWIVLPLSDQISHGVDAWSPLYAKTEQSMTRCMLGQFSCSQISPLHHQPRDLFRKIRVIIRSNMMLWFSICTYY